MTKQNSSVLWELCRHSNGVRTSIQFYLETRDSFIQEDKSGLCLERYVGASRIDWSHSVKSRDHSGQQWFDETKGGCAGWGQGSGKTLGAPLPWGRPWLETAMSHWEGSPCWYLASSSLKVLKEGMTTGHSCFHPLCQNWRSPYPLPNYDCIQAYFQKSTTLLLKIVSLSLGAHNFTAQYFRRQYACFHSLQLILTPDCRSSTSLSGVLLSQITSHDGSHLVREEMSGI